MGRTVSSNVRVGGILGYVTSAFTNDETEFDCGCASRMNFGSVFQNGDDGPS